MEREKLPRQVLINWILSYSLVLLIPLAGFSLCNLQWKQTLRRATAEANQQILHSISMAFDEKIGDLYAAQNFVLTRI